MSKAPAHATLDQLRTIAVHYVLEDLGPLVATCVDRAMRDVLNPDAPGYDATELAGMRTQLAAHGVQAPVFMDDTAPADMPPPDVVAAEAALAAAEAELAAAEAELDAAEAEGPPSPTTGDRARLRQLSEECQLAVLGRELQRRADALADEQAIEREEEDAAHERLCADILERADAVEDLPSEPSEPSEPSLEGDEPAAPSLDGDSRLTALLAATRDDPDTRDARILIVSHILGLGGSNDAAYRLALRTLLEASRTPPPSPRENSEPPKAARPSWIQRANDRNARVNNRVNEILHLVRSTPGIAQLPGPDRPRMIGLVNTTSNPLPVYLEANPKKSESAVDRRTRLRSTSST